MGERQTPIQTVRDRLTGLLADWGAELSMVLKELEEKRSRVEELETKTAGRDGQFEALQKRAEGQDALIEALKGDAEEASKLRKEIRAKDLEFERLSSELDSKKELIRALRRDAEGADRSKADAKLKDREIERLKAEGAQAEQRAQQAAAELNSLRDSVTDRESEGSAELEAVRAELDARKTLIKSLRADQERVSALEASLQEKRDVIEQLEASINRHANTITELKRNADAWKRKYQALKGNGAAETSTQLPTLSDTDVRAIENLEKNVETKSDSTIAIDMRRSLLEARRTSRGHGEK
jgi:DNA repair exonuclease SbcCD ATPase subunit